jgi:hypothetical protein
MPIQLQQICKILPKTAVLFYCNAGRGVLLFYRFAYGGCGNTFSYPAINLEYSFHGCSLSDVMYFPLLLFHHSSGYLAVNPYYVCAGGQVANANGTAITRCRMPGYFAAQQVGEGDEGHGAGGFNSELIAYRVGVQLYARQRGAFCHTHRATHYLYRTQRAIAATVHPCRYAIRTLAFGITYRGRCSSGKQHTPVVPFYKGMYTGKGYSCCNVNRTTYCNRCSGVYLYIRMRRICYFSYPVVRIIIYINIAAGI